VADYRHNVAVVFDHLLVVAATLVRGSSFDCFAHENINFDVPSLDFSKFK
jgi:hypothetical protein